MTHRCSAILKAQYLALLLFWLPATTCLAESTVTLKLFNWPDYIGKEVLAQFEEQQHIKVDVVTYESDELKDDLLLRTNGGEGLDLITSARHSMGRMIKQNWMLPLDNNALPSRKHLMPRFDNAQNNVHANAVPYFWGTLGIAWRKDKITTPPTSWNAFFTPPPALKGKIMTINDSQDSVSMALKAAGYSANENAPDALAKAKLLLQTQQPSVGKYSYPTLDETSELLGNDIWIAMIYNGDALTLNGFNSNIEYTVPTEGTSIWVDYIGILATSKHPAEAHAFINYLCDPQVSARNAQALNFAPANASAEGILPEEFKNNPTIYPPQEVLSLSEQYQDLTPQAQKQRTDLFMEVSN